jgi:CRISPR-associated protein Cas6
MTDAVFAVTGQMLPADYAFALWREVARLQPWLETEENAGLLPLRAPEHGNDLLLPRRTRLVMRIPADRLAQAVGLSGHELDLGGYPLVIGKVRERPLQPSPTLHAQLVASSATEPEFLAAMADDMRRYGIAGKLICGKRHEMPGSAGKIAGYSLVVHELPPKDALHLQWRGLGSERHFGCGIFIPYKPIANLGVGEGANNN